MAAVAEDSQAEKQLRSEYRSLLERAKHNKHNLVSTDNNQLQEVLKVQDELHQRVSKPREQALDSELFAVVTEAGKEYVTKLARGGKSYTTGDFVRRLKAHYVHDMDAQERGAFDPTAFDWAGLGRVVAKLFRPAPVVFHMLGPIDARPKERRHVVRQKRKAQVGDAVRPEELENIGDTEKQETDKNMEEMWGVLNDQGGRCNLLQLVLNHRSFSQTVENLFTLSFLVRDQRVELHSSENGTEVVKRSRHSGPKAEGERERVQFVIGLDIEQWEGWKAVVAPGSCLMRNRVEHHHVDLQQQQQQQQVEDSEADEGQQRQQQQQQGEQDEDEEEEEEPRPASSKRSRRR